MKLTDEVITSLKGTGKARKVSDGGGLHIYLSPSGGKHWRMGYRFAGKQKLLSFGAYPAVSLEDARAKRAEAKRLLANGFDPGEIKKDLKGNGVSYAAEIRFMCDKMAELAQLAVKNKLSLEVSVGARMPEGEKGVGKIEPIGTFVINCTGKE